MQNKVNYSKFISNRGRCASWKYSTLWKFSLHFVYIFRTDWNFAIKFANSDPSFRFQISDFKILIFKIQNICTCSNYYYSLLFIIYKFLDMIWIWNLHWGYILINEVSQWFYQLDHVNFSKNVFWSVNCTLMFYQIYDVQISTL